MKPYSVHCLPLLQYLWNVIKNVIPIEWEEFWSTMINSANGTLYQVHNPDVWHTGLVNYEDAWIARAT